MQTGALFNCEYPYHSAFPVNPMEVYQKQGILLRIDWIHNSKTKKPFF